ncbi:MAG: trimethylamine methyltransferase family protein [Pseudomonadota bacterium]
METIRIKRAGGRSARKAKRAAAPEINPAPPGPAGGAYKPLSESALTAIHETALKLLEEPGIGDAPPSLVEAATARGAYVNKRGRLALPAELVDWAIDQTPKRILFPGRDPGHDFEIGGEKVYFGTGGAAVQTLDLESGLYRPSTLSDLYDFTRLIDRLNNVSWFTRCCVATDVPDNFELDVNTAYALLRGTTKPVGTSFFVGEHVDPVIDMFDEALGGKGRFAERPFCKVHISPVISPLRYGEDAVAVAEAAVRRGMIVNQIIAAQSGATAPAAPAGFLAQSHAETLAGLVMVQCLAPGHPTIFSNWPFVIDLRTGAFAGSGGETAAMNAAAAQLGNWLGLPTGVAASMADAKAPDAQMGAEKALTTLAAGLAGANMVYESSGMMGSLLGASFEAFVLDDEMLSHVYRTIRGIEVTPETLGYDDILATVDGPGHFLGGAPTMAAMERDYFYPAIGDRDPPSKWAEEGAETAWDRAKAKARDMLASPDPGYLDAAADKAIRSRFNILLD